jgi:hypothetical protein
MSGSRLPRTGGSGIEPETGTSPFFRKKNELAWLPGTAKPPLDLDEI